MKIDRRSFFAGSAGALVALSNLRPAWARLAASAANDGSDRTLVLVQLLGGNDGLNWIVPHGHDAYYRARPSLSVRAGEVLKVDDEIGFSPSCPALSELWQEGQVSIVQGVGYPDPDRSHFRSMDIWDSAQPEVETPKEGWIGRWLSGTEARASGRLPALRIGSGPVPLSLIASGFEAPSLERREDLELAAGDEVGAALREATSTPRQGSDALEYLRTSSRRAWQVADTLEGRSGSYRPKAEYPGTELARKLSLVAQLIRADFGTRVYHVALSGFDTHSRQRPGHDALLRILSDALGAFWADLQGHGLAERSMVMVHSEFGRRVAENGSQGTDHGAAAPVVLLGSKLTQGIHGKHPSFDDLDDGDLRFSIDFRSIYQSILEDWLGGDAKPVLGKRLPAFPLVG
ncbi:MAG: DUF1501 domain-containing protein [Planctomycetota bacterium]